MTKEIRMVAAEATPESFSRFGQVVTATGRAAAFESPEFDFYGDLATGDFGAELSFGMVVARPGPPVATTFERHLHTPELVAPLNGAVTVVVGEAGPGDPPEEGRYAAFRLRPGSALVIGPGVWHFAPLADDAETSILIGFRGGTPTEDMELHNLDEERGLRFIVADD